jgi:hexosaminidase
MPTKSKPDTVRSSPCLLPEPRLLDLSGGNITLTPGRLIVIKAASPASFLFEAQQAQRALSEYADVTWHIVASDAVPTDNIGLMISYIDSTGAATDQSYTLDITPECINIYATGHAGIFYGVATLTQIVRQYGAHLPLLHIEDYPDYPVRGVMFDISRDKVPTMPTLFGLVDLLAGLKINELQLYTEHTFAYQRHPVVWQNASPLTGEEILQLDAYCRSRHVSLVPNQNSFGHMQRWLTHDQYRALAEAPNGCDTRWGRFDEPFSLCPGDPGSIRLISDLYEELLPHFTSDMLNVGCDETVDLGVERSKADCAERGTGRVYLDFLLKIYKLVKQHGRTMQFWGDIIMEHPELVPELPRDVIALEWGYEYDHPFYDHGAKFAASGIPFYVCPGTSSWNSIGGRTDNALGNLLNAAENGLKHGAIGYLITDWGDNGHHQPLPVSYLGYAYGAAVSWYLEGNRNTDIARAIGIHVFQDPSGAAGKLAYEIGNVYRVFQNRIHNATPYALGTVQPMDKLAITTNSTEIKQALREIDRLAKSTSKMHTHSADAHLLQREFLFVLSLMRFGVKRIAVSQAKEKDRKSLLAELRPDLRHLTAEHKKLWLARNRPGGLDDSVRKLVL